MSEETPIFVKVEEYKDVLDIVKVLRDKIKQTQKTLSDINRLKNEEDAEIEMWTRNLEEINEKVQFIDNLLFQPKF